MSARLLQLHGVIVDLIYRVDKVPQTGSEASVRGCTMAAGGGFNAMVAAKRCGLEVSYGGSLGTGPLSELVASALANAEIDRLRPRDQLRDQGCCTVMVDSNGERTFVAAEGAEGHVNLADLQPIEPSTFDWCLLSGYALYYRASRDAFTHWLSRDVAIPNLVFDPGPIIRAVPPIAVQAALTKAAWVSANKAEAQALSGINDPTLAALKLAAGRSGGAIVRIGAQGCIVAWDGNSCQVPGHRVRAVDTNGAGDTHVGTFIAALAHGHEPAAAARHANIAAALSAEQLGPACAPDIATIEATLRRTSAKSTSVTTMKRKVK